jgi:hypothetical protein
MAGGGAVPAAGDGGTVCAIAAALKARAADPHNSADFHGDIMWFTPQEREALEE